MIQIDMPMPKNCAACCFATADLVNGIITLFCMTPAGRKMYAPDLISRKDRPEWCPLKEQDNEYENGFNDAMQGKRELMYEGIDGKWYKKDW